VMGAGVLGCECRCMADVSTSRDANGTEGEDVPGRGPASREALSRGPRVTRMRGWR
jgi:hypothetical protein